MSSINTIAPAENSTVSKDAAQAGSATRAEPAAASPKGPAIQGAAVAVDKDVLPGDEKRPRERFLPVTRFALMDRLTHREAWPQGMAAEVRRFFRYLDYWREQQYDVEAMDLEQAYEPFNPDSDLLITRKFTDADRRVLQQRVVTHMKKLLKQANYENIDPAKVELILTKETHYGLDLTLDFDVFEELVICFRGATSRTDYRRTWRKFLLKQEFHIPIFRRLFVLFKVRSEEDHIRKVMASHKADRREAEKIVRRSRSILPDTITPGNIYMKLFKNMPRADIEMCFPNTRVRFRLYDKIKLGVTTGGGLGYGMFSLVGKIALITHPVAAAGALATLGGIIFRQAVSFMNQRQRYMVVLAQNLYFHSMADNRAAIVKLAGRAAEEDVKEEMLLYCILCKQPARRSDLKAVDEAIEQYLFNEFGIHVNFDIEDALERLIADELVIEKPDGTLQALPPREAAEHLDRKWDLFLDHLPDIGAGVGVEIEDANNAAAQPEEAAAGDRSPV